MIAPEMRQRNGLPPRPEAAAYAPHPSVEPETGQLSAAAQAVRSVIGGATGRYPLAVLITAAAVVGVTAGWLVKRR